MGLTVGLSATFLLAQVCDPRPGKSFALITLFALTMKELVLGYLLCGVLFEASRRC